ncbi:MAG: hypothetical protein B7Z06_07095 [Flavobacteriales bacterium 32-35-8]|nr:MAG: hypothetical protein B7Z06_07095 [Flavobacteriales bacterium 32-35-8]
MKKKNDINEIVSNEILKRTIDISIDYSELSLDAFLEEGLLKEIPFVKSIVGFYNISNSIIERHKVNKILTFFKTFHEGNIDGEKLEKFKEKFSADKKYQNKVIEIIILLNERFLQIEKSKILANLLLAHIKNELSWEEFQDISMILEVIHPRGFDFLHLISKELNWANQSPRINVDEVFMIACGIGYRHGSRFYISHYGQKLFNFGIKPLN